MPEFRVKMAIIGFIIFSCGSPDRACWVEHKYDEDVALGVKVTKFRKKLDLQFSQPERLTGLVLWQVDKYEQQQRHLEVTMHIRVDNKERCCH